MHLYHLAFITVIISVIGIAYAVAFVDVCGVRAVCGY